MALTLSSKEGGSASCVLITNNYRGPGGDIGQYKPKQSFHSYFQIDKLRRLTIIRFHHRSHSAFAVMRASSRLIKAAKQMHDVETEVPGLYFFRVFTNGVQRHSSDGILFENKLLAWQEASESTGQIIRDMDGKIEAGLDWRMDVADQTGKVIYQFSFKADNLDKL